MDTEDQFPFENDSRWSLTDVTLAFAETLVHFFAALPDGMVPSSAYPIITETAEEDASEVSLSLLLNSVDIE